MAKVAGPLMSYRATGRVGKATYATRGNLSTVAPIDCPSEHWTPSRPTTATRVKTISTKWATLTPSQKDAWSQAASPGHTGFTQFLRVNTCRLFYAMALLSSPSTASSLSDDLRVQVKVTETKPFTFQLKISASTWKQTYIWLRAAPCNFTRYADTHRYGRIRTWYTSSGTTRTVIMPSPARAALISLTALPVLGAGPSLRLKFILRADETHTLLHADLPFTSIEPL